MEPLNETHRKLKHIEINIEIERFFFICREKAGNE